MAKLSEILTLAKAGFKAKEIVEMVKNSEEDGAGEKPEKEQEKPESTPFDELNKQIALMTERFNAMETAIQAAENLNAEMGQAEVKKPESVESIFAGVIGANPPQTGGNDG